MVFETRAILNKKLQTGLVQKLFSFAQLVTSNAAIEMCI